MSEPKQDSVEIITLDHQERASTSVATHAVPITISSSNDFDGEIATYENRKMDARTFLATVSLAFTYEAGLLSFVLPTAILFSINADIGPSMQINWVATAWSLSSAVVQTIAGRCSDIFGRRNFTLAGNLLGLAGCAIASRASSVNTVIAGSALMGIGSAGQQLSWACASEIVPKKARGQVLAFLNLAALPGSAFGSVIAFALVAHLSWRWAFYIGIIANGFALLLTGLFYWPPSFIGLHPEGKSRLQLFQELDFLGLVLFGGGLGAFLLGLSFGNNPHPWSSKHVLAPLLIGAVTLFVAFPAWEFNCPKKTAKLCPPAIFKNVRGFTLPICVVFVSGMLSFGPKAINPFHNGAMTALMRWLEVQLLFATDPTTVGWYSLSYNAAATLGGVVASVMFARIRRTRWQFLLVTILQCVFIASMASIDQHSPRRAIAFVAIAAFNVGASQIIGTLIIQFGANDREIRLATGLTGSIRATGGAIAIAIYGSIITSRVQTNLVPDVTAAAIEAGLPSSAIKAFITALTSGSSAALGSIESITPDIIAAGRNSL
ncbi:hypothetical protein V499_02051 [Pseudogymnoascus sp. VKM F-103]|nr:hypothetical protein V499_02051 [Pseudogymnoascus sp. VKM F-103]